MKSLCSDFTAMRRLSLTLEFSKCAFRRCRMILGIHHIKDFCVNDPTVANRRVACSMAPDLILS
jgi:hypothetical protein